MKSGSVCARKIETGVQARTDFADHHVDQFTLAGEAIVENAQMSIGAGAHVSRGDRTHAVLDGDLERGLDEGVAPLLDGHSTSQREVPLPFDGKTHRVFDCGAAHEKRPRGQTLPKPPRKSKKSHPPQLIFGETKITGIHSTLRNGNAGNRALKNGTPFHIPTMNRHPTFL